MKSVTVVIAILCCELVLKAAAGAAPGVSTLSPTAAQNRPIVAKADVKGWFKQFDALRRKFQMNPEAKKHGKRLSRIAILPGTSPQDKAAAKAMLIERINVNSRAVTAFRQLRTTPETRALQDGFITFYTNAALLCMDYMKALDRFTAVDASGRPVISLLPEKGDALEKLDAANKLLDARLRNKYHVPAYQSR